MTVAEGVRERSQQTVLNRSPVYGEHELEVLTVPVRSELPAAATSMPLPLPTPTSPAAMVAMVVVVVVVGRASSSSRMAAHRRGMVVVAVGEGDGLRRCNDNSWPSADVCQGVGGNSG